MVESVVAAFEFVEDGPEVTKQLVKFEFGVR